MPPPSAGLCESCSHARRVPTARGNIFLLCRRSEDDPRYARYPHLPVLSCVGHSGFRREEIQSLAKPGMSPCPRVISLLPAATEIVGALGALDHLVGVSHECDFPPGVERKPRVTHCEIHGAGLPSAAVDVWVRESVNAHGTLYTMDEQLLRELRPELILTQKLCDVCAASYGSVAALAATLPGPPEVVDLDPSSLDDILEDIHRVAGCLGLRERGQEVVRGLRERVEAVRARAAAATSRPRTVLLEWIDPPYRAGHWNPELVELAGGSDLVGVKGQDSTRATWGAVLEAAPEVLVLACCGYSVERTLRDLPLLAQKPGWGELPAVRAGRVFAVDGCAYFSRPGPRIVDSLEILAEILHPELFAGLFPDRGTRRA